MRDLIYYRPSYQIEGELERVVEDAHRVVRSAASIGAVLLPYDVMDPAMQAIERVENEYSDERVIEPGDVAVLAAMLPAVAKALNEALDDEQRPRGPGGERILREASLPTTLPGGIPDFDRVFELRPDGVVGVCHPRMSLYDLRISLPDVANLLADAVSRGARVVVVE